MVQTFNGVLGEQALSESNLNEVYETWWPNLKLRVEKILENHKVPNTKRADSDILKEILEKVRGIETNSTLDKARSHSTHFDELLKERLNEELEKLEQLRQDDIKLLINTDILTGLASRKRILEIAQERLELKQSFCIVVLDINGFKSINDLHGHDVGDQVLQEIARRFETTIYEKGAVSRVGGDEYLLVLDVSDIKQLNTLLEDIQENISKSILINGINIKTNASVGFSFYPTDGNNIDVLFETADRNMFLAKDHEHEW